jgi:hypothetical protein
MLIIHDSVSVSMGMAASVYFRGLLSKLVITDRSEARQRRKTDTIQNSQKVINFNITEIISLMILT